MGRFVVNQLLQRAVSVSILCIEMTQPLDPLNLEKNYQIKI